MSPTTNEHSPLLGEQRQQAQQEGHAHQINFSKEDPEDPRQWPYRKKMINVAVIALMAVLSPLASSMFTPAMSQIADDLDTTVDVVIGATSGFVMMLGAGPTILAPLSEIFGRRNLYLINFTIFTLLQIPAALSPNIACLLVVRTLAGFFGSVGIANGGGTISDMFIPSERAGVFGWYLLGPLLGPSLGPLAGAVIADNLNWRWIFWVLTIICAINTILGYVFLKETYAPALLAHRCKEAEAESDGDQEYTFPGHDTRPLFTKLQHSMLRPVKILVTQPMVLALAAFQAVIFASMYTLYTNMQEIFASKPYMLSTSQVGLLYLVPGVGFLVAVLFLVPRIDVIFNAMSKRNNGKEAPEFRLPLANVGSVILPITLFWFGWSVEYGAHWAVCIAATFFFGFGQVAVFNSVQNYYIDAFPEYAASAIAAGAVFRSFVGGVVPLVAPELFRRLGYGWGWSVFGFLTLAIAPSPLLFMRYGRWLREKFSITL